MADGGHHDGIGVAMGSGIGVALEASVDLHVADDGLDGVAAFEFALDGGRDDAACVADVDLGPISALDAVTAIAPVDIGALDFCTGDAGDLGELVGQRVPVARQTGPGLGAQHELAAGAAGVGDGKTRLDPELVAGPGLALADTFDLRGMEGIELAASGSGSERLGMDGGAPTQRLAARCADHATTSRRADRHARRA